MATEVSEGLSNGPVHLKECPVLPTGENQHSFTNSNGDPNRVLSNLLTAHKLTPWTELTFRRLCSEGKVKGCYKVRGRLVFNLEELRSWLLSTKKVTSQEAATEIVANPKRKTRKR